MKIARERTILWCVERLCWGPAVAKSPDDLDAALADVEAAIQHLKSLLPVLVSCARKAGAKETADRLVRLAAGIPEDNSRPSTAAASDVRKPARVGRGKTLGEMRSRINAAGARGIRRETLREEAMQDGIPRSSAFWAISRLLETQEITEHDGRLYGLQHAPIRGGPRRAAGAAAEAKQTDAEQHATAPARDQREDELP